MNFRVEKLERGHAVEGFDCGSDALNRFLIRYALRNELARLSHIRGELKIPLVGALPLRAGMRLHRRQFE